MTIENENYRVVIADVWEGSHSPGSLIEFSSLNPPIGDILVDNSFSGKVYADGYVPAAGMITQYDDCEAIFTSQYQERESSPDLPVRTTFYYTLKGNSLHISWRVDTDDVIEFEKGMVWTWQTSSWDYLQGYNHVGEVDSYDLAGTISGAETKAIRTAWKLTKSDAALWIVQPDPFQARWQIKNDYLEQEWLQSRYAVTTLNVNECPRICSALSPENSIWGEVELCISPAEDEAPFDNKGYMMLSGMPNGADQALALMWDEAPIPGDYFNPMTIPDNPDTPYGGKIVQLLENHPNMKNVMLLAVDKILGYYPFKPVIPCWWTPEAFVSVDTVNQFQGEGALTISHYTSGETWVYQTFPCNPNDEIQVSGWIKIDSLSEGYSGLMFTGSDSISSPEELLFSNPIDWTYFVSTFSANDNTELTLNVGINGGTGMVWFDDLSVMNTVTQEELIGNGGFDDYTFKVWWDGEGSEWCHFHGNLRVSTNATQEYKEWFNMLEDGGTTLYGWEDRMSTGFHCYHHTPNELYMLGGDNGHEFNFYNPEFDSATFYMIKRDLEDSGLSNLTLRTMRFAGFKHHLPTVIEAIKAGAVFIDRAWTISNTCLLGTIIRPEGVVWESNTNWWMDYSTWSGTTIARSLLERGEFVLAGGHPVSSFPLDHPEHFNTIDDAFNGLEADYPNMTYLFPHDYATLCEESRQWWNVCFDICDDVYMLSFFGAASRGQTVVQVIPDSQLVNLPPLVDGLPVSYEIRENRIIITLPELPLGLHTVIVGDGGTNLSSSVTPELFSFDPPYPNPCNACMTFPLTLSHAADVKLSIFDTLGRHVLQETYSLQAGIRKLSLNLEFLTSGIYFYRIYTNQEIQYGKITMLK